MLAQTLGLILGFLITIISGFPFTFALLRKRVSRLEIAIYSFILGLGIPSTLSFIEGYFVNFSPIFYFSLPIAIFNHILFFLIGLAFLFFEKVSFNELKEFFEIKFEAKQLLFPALVLLILVLVFYQNFGGISIAPIYYEFDPYFYMFTTQYLFAYGFIPQRDISAWPGEVTSHATTPLLPYLTAFWTQLYMFISNASYSRDLLAYVASVYPPVAAALLAFALIEILSNIYNKKIGLFAGFLIATMPIIVLSFSPGHAQEQPWGVMGVYLFVASYLLAGKTNSKRLGVLAGIIYGLTLLGSKYFLVTALIAPAFMILYSTFEFFVGEKEKLEKFNSMNLYMIVVITLFYIIYLPYASYTKVVQVIFGYFPVTLLVILSGFIYSIVIQLYFSISSRFKINLGKYTYFGIVILISSILILISPLGKYLLGYVFFTASFARPKIPLYMTVAEYAWSGFSFNFGSVFGLIGFRTPYNFFVVSILAISFISIIVRSLQKREALLIILPVIVSMAYMGFSEQKYLLHFAPAYAIVFSIVVGEIFYLISKFLEASGIKKENKDYFTYGFLFVLAFSQGIIPIVDTLVMSYYILSQQQPNCNSIQRYIITYNNFCMTIPAYWQNSMEWIENNSGPNGPRILSWWDYGHWINWFGNSNAVLRNDNAFPEMDYNIAALFIMTSKDGFGAKALEEYMNKVQAKYVLLDQDLIFKWGALNFLGCVFANKTNMSFAFEQGEKQGIPYAIGTSKCEEEHSPVYVLIPLNITSTSQLCSENSIKVYATNSQTFCFKPSQYQYNESSIGEFYTTTGEKIKAIAPPALCVPQKSGELYYYQCLLLYYSLDSPGATKYYNSTFYRLFFMSNLSGFKQVFPNNAEVYDFGNGLSFAPVRIFELINYTGGNVTHQLLPNQKFQLP